MAALCKLTSVRLAEAGLWNVDGRTDAASEAFEAGAEPADVMKIATHTQLLTTMIYNRSGVVQSSRIAGLRQARRNASKQEAVTQLNF